jgi:hypothetical protein
MPLVRDGKSKRRSDPFPAPRSPLMSVLSSPRSPMSSRQAVAGGFRALVPSTRGKPIRRRRQPLICLKNNSPSWGIRLRHTLRSRKDPSPARGQRRRRDKASRSARCPRRRFSETNLRFRLRVLPTSRPGRRTLPIPAPRTPEA